MIFLLLFFSSVSFANDFSCDTQQILHGKWAINRFFTMADGCLVQITPIDKPNLTYREYVFDQMGRFAIFNSTPGSYEEATAMQTYFLLPAKQAPSIRKSHPDYVEVVLASGEIALFSKENLFLESLQGRGIQYQEEKSVSLVEGGGFELLAHEELFINAGWKIGGRSYRDPNRSSELKWNGKSCWIQNSLFFVYTDSITGQELYQPALRWNLSQLQGWFQEQCSSGFDALDRL